MALRTHARLTLIIIVSLLAGAILTASALMVVLHHHGTPLLPKEVTDNANFLLYTPKQNSKDDSAWRIVPPRPSFDKQAGTVTLTLQQTVSSVTIVLIQQATPGVFSDIPQQYANMLNALHQYDEIQTSFGTITLTHPEELKGGQTAVANKSSTLLFARPSKDLTKDQWQQFFESLHIVQ